MARSKKKAAFIAAESAYATDPSSNGSSYLWIPALTLPEIPIGQTNLETNYFTARPFDTAPIAGPGGGTFDMEIPVIGLSDSAANGQITSDTADDWFDNFMESIFTDSPTERTGEAVSSSSTSSLTLDAAATDIAEQDLVAVYGAALATRTQWAMITDDASDPTLSIAPTLPTSPGASTAYGVRHYYVDGFSNGFGGSSQAIVIEDGGHDTPDNEQIGAYMFLGCRPTAFSVAAEAGQAFRASVTWGFDSVTEDSANKTSLPNPGVAPAVTPLICTLSPVWFNNTLYATRRIEINFGITAQEIGATSGANGRSGWEILRIDPVITIEPLRTDAIRELRRDVTSGRLLIQLGAGVPSGSVLNTCAIHAEEAYVMEADGTDENGRARQTVSIKVIDPGFWTAGTIARFFQFCRA